MKQCNPLCIVGLLLVAASTASSAPLTLLSNTSANLVDGFSAGEIVDFDKSTDRMFVTSSGLGIEDDPTSGVYRVNIFDIADPTMPMGVGSVDFTTTFGAAADMLSLSSVAVDPLGRSGAVALIPSANTTTVGKVGFFNPATGAVIGSADAGYHPDSVAFS